MAKPVGGLTVFQNNTTNSLVNLDNNFAALVAAINDPGSYTNYGVDSGVVNSLVLTLTGYSLSAYADGQIYTVKVAVTNTAASVLNVNALGTKTILRKDGSALQPGDMVAGNSYQFIYNSSLSGGVGGFNLVDSLPQGFQITAAGTLDSNPLSATAWNFNLAGSTWMTVSTARAVTINAATSGSTLTLSDTAGFALNIASTINSLSKVQIQNSNAGASAEMDLYLQSDVVVFRAQILSAAAGGNARLFTQSAHQLNLGANGGSQFGITTGGLIGIGTITPGNYGNNSEHAAVVSASGILAPVLALVNPNSATNTAVALDFVPNTNIALGQIRNVRNAAADTDFFFTNYSGSTMRDLVKIQGAGTIPGLYVNADVAGTYYEVGFRSLPSNTYSGTLVATQRGFLLQLNGNITVPNAVFNAGDVVSVTAAAARVINQGAGFTLTLAGTTSTGNRNIAANGEANILFTSSSAGLISGPGVT